MVNLPAEEQTSVAYAIMGKKSGGSESAMSPEAVWWAPLRWFLMRLHCRNDHPRSSVERIRVAKSNEAN